MECPFRNQVRNTVDVTLKSKIEKLKITDKIRKTDDGNYFLNFTVDHRSGTPRRIKELVRLVNNSMYDKSFGEVLSVYDQNPNGIEFNINYPQALLDHLEYLEIIREVEQEAVKGTPKNNDNINQTGTQLSFDFLFSPRNPNSNQAMDNWGAIYANKKEILDNYYKQSFKLKSELDLVEDSVKRAKYKEVQNKIKRLNDELSILESNETSVKYHAISQDLKDIADALDTNEMIDMAEISKMIEFYDGLNFDITIPEEANIMASIKDLKSKQEIFIENQTIKILESSEEIDTVLTNLNSQLNPNEKDVFTVKDLLTVDRDISVFDKYASGLISTNSSDTIIPQYLLSRFMETVNEKENFVINLTDRLDELNKKHPNVNKEILFEKDFDNNYTGNLINIYTPSWSAVLKKRKALIKNLADSIVNGTYVKRISDYKKLIKDYKKNSEIVDFTKLSEVKAIYGNRPEYSKYFTSSDAEIQQYENDLKDLLGTGYDFIVSQVIEKLALYDNNVANDTSPFKERNEARANVWEFNDKYKKNDYTPIEYTYGTQTSDVFFRAWDDLIVIPKKNIPPDPMTGNLGRDFYSENFKTVENDPVLYEFWKVYRDMSTYLGNVYELNNNGKIKIPLLKKNLSQQIVQSAKDLKAFKMSALGDIYSNSVQAYKSWFYDKSSSQKSSEGIINNNPEVFNQEVINKTKKYQLQGFTKEEAKQKAINEVTKEATVDMDMAFKASLLSAAVHDARIEIEPTARMMKNVYENIYRKSLGKDPTESIAAVERMAAWMDKVVYNKSFSYREAKGVEGEDIKPLSAFMKFMAFVEKTFIGKKLGIGRESFKFYSEGELEILNSLRDLLSKDLTSDLLYEDTVAGENFKFKYDSAANKYVVNDFVVSKDVFNSILEKYINNYIQSKGVALNLSGIIDGLLKTSILKSLGLSPVSGVFNRVEGIHTLHIMDSTGHYWRPGNNIKSKRFISFANISSLSKKLSNKAGLSKKYKDIELFKQVVERIGNLQDRKDELQRSADGEKLEGALMNSLFAWAVSNPEFKNQGQVLLNVLQDTIIKDSNGVEYQFFDGKGFPAFELNPQGILKLKDGFENFDFSGKEMQKIMYKCSVAISRVNGNYNKYDIMLAKKTAWGRAATLFKTWLPEQLNQRFGIKGTDDAVVQGQKNKDLKALNIDLATGKERQEGRFVQGYKGSKASTITMGLGAMGIGFGFAGPLGLIGVGALGAYVAKNYLSKHISSTKQDAKHAAELAQMIKSVLIETLNYPLHLFSTRGFENRSYENLSYLTEQEIRSLRAMTKELAISLVLVSAKLMIGAMMYDEEDDPKSPARRRYNFIQNEFSKAITTLLSYTSPNALIEDSSRIGAIKQISDIYNLLRYGVYEGDFTKFSKSVTNLMPIPRTILTMDNEEGIKFLEIPWEDKTNYDTSPFTEVPFLAWTQKIIKDIESDGEYSSKAEWTEIRSEVSSMVDEEYMNLVGGNKEILRIISDSYKAQMFEKKTSEKTYKQLLKNYENDKNKKYETDSKNRKKLIQKLRDEGLSVDKIQAIIEKRYE